MRRPLKAIVAIFASLLSMFAIGAGTAAAADPTLTVDAPSSITYTTAHVSGTVNPNGGPAPIYLVFEYQRPGASFWSQEGYFPIEGAAAEGTSPIPLEANLSKLTAGVEYEVRLRAYIEGEYRYSPVQTFTTIAIPAPSISLDPPTSVTGASAHFAGTIDPEAPAGNPSASDVKWQFVCTPECPGLSGTIAADSTSHVVSADPSGLLPNTNYEVKLVAENAGPVVSTPPATFKTLKVAPVVEPLFATIEGPQAVLRGQVNPRNSTATYRFEWGTTTAYGNAIPVAPVSLGFQDNSMHTVTAPISGLAPGATYHFRLVATNAESAVQTQGADRSFTTPIATPPSSCPNELFRVGFGSVLPDCRAYEQVTPVDKEGLEPLIQEGIIQENFMVAPGGDTALFVYPGAFGDAAASEQTTSYLSTRGAGTWTTHSPEIMQPASPTFGAVPKLATSTDLSHSVYYSHAALTADAVAGDYNVYLEDNRTGRLELIFTTPERPYIVNFTSPANIGGTPNFSHVLLRETTPLTPDAPNNELPKLYDFHDGQLHLVSYGANDQPSTAVVPRPFIYSGAPGINGWISADGTRLVYPLATGEGPDQSIGLFERVNGHTVRVGLSRRTGEVGTAEASTVLYVSNDGSAVYLCSFQPLADSGGPRSPIYGGWIYREQNGQLTELTRREGPNEPRVGKAYVAGDGAYVYVLEQDKLFAWHAGEYTVVGEGFNPSSYSAMGSSPDGRYFAISSSVSLNGQDNRNPAKCQSVGAEPGDCLEVYLYDALTKEMECASCRTDGGQPIGDSGFGAAEPNAVVSDNGTVFFNSPDPLVPTDVNGRSDVYEFRHGVATLISTGTSSRPSILGGTSTDGKNVYFSTDAQLVGQDTDHLVDIYDARVDGGLTGQYPPEPPPGCEGEACKGPISNPPDGGSPGTAAFVGGTQSSRRAVSSRCQALSSKARAATKKAKAKPRGTQRQKALKHAKQLHKKASKCKAGGA